VREGCIDTVKILVEAGAKADLNSGELVKVEEGAEDEDDDEFDSLEEKYFMEAFKNCMTPLQVAGVLGYDEIAVFLIENGANVNL
jgi:ankyrin repeat protein